MAPFTSGRRIAVKRYWLFDFSFYYPGGGMNDLAGSFDTAEEAETAAQERGRELWQVVDSQTGEIVKDKP
jgi:hypothetical protein